MIRRHLPVFLACFACAAATALWLMNRGADVALPSFTEVRESFRPSDTSLLDEMAISYMNGGSIFRYGG
jgi:hypothetical protein